MTPSGESLWPASVMSEESFGALRGRVGSSFIERMRQLQIEESLFDELCRAYLPLAAWVARQKGPTSMILGVSGAQGSGKSTLCELLALSLRQGFGHRVACFSIDDVYKTHADRERLAAEIHPLLITRGVPGTHDVDLALSVIESLVSATPDAVTRIPAFDKARDDRRPENEWPSFRGAADVVIFEGWCLGAVPQDEAALAMPINELERTEDPAGIWRHYVNARLASEYNRLFARLHKLIMLKVPSLESVHEWRGLQERKLAAATDLATLHHLMDASALKRFIMHYERLTRALLGEIPKRADVTMYLDAQHKFTRIQLRD